MRGLLSVALLTAVAAAVAGCSQWRGSGGGESLVLTSAARDGVVYAPPAKTLDGVYRRVDASTADVYLTDLDIDALAHGRPVDKAGEGGGGVMHIRLFMPPRAGRTPLDDSGCNLSIRQVIVAHDGARGGAAMGLYAGGGFAYPSGTIGDSTLGGTIDGATLRLTRATPSFEDLLGPSTAAVRFSVRRDDETAQRIGLRLDEWASRMPSVKAEEP